MYHGDRAATLRQTVMDEHRIDILHVRQTDQFVDCGIVTDITSEVRISLAPLFCRHPE